MNYDLVVDLSIMKKIGTSLQLAFNIACLFTTATPITGYTTNKTKLYTDADSVAKDWGADTAPHKKATAYFSQSPSSNQLRIAKRSTPVATIKTLTVSATLTAGAKINGIVNGVALEETSFDTSHSATMTALAAKIAAIAGIASAVVSTNVITITASVNYSLDLDSFEISGVTPALTIAIATTTAGSSISNDISAAKIEVNDWYEVFLDSTNAGDILSTAKAIEALPKIATLLSSDTNILNSAITNDIASELKKRNFARTNINYHHAPSEAFDAAIVSRCLGEAPGQAMRFNRDVTGPSITSLDSDQIKNISNKNCNCYPQMGTTGGYYNGVMANGVSIEIQRDIDYLDYRVTVELFDFLKIESKVGYDPDGVTKTMAKLKIVFESLVSENVIQPNYKLIPPNLATISTADKNAHILPNVQFEAEIKKGIKKVLIKGAVY